VPITHAHLYDQIADFDNLMAAYLAARRGKRYRREVALFSINLEENLLNIHNHLVWGSWRPGRAREFRVHEPKLRDIQAPPFADRIVHHALVRVVEPLFERRFIHHSYACRAGKGSQRACRAVQQMIRAAQRESTKPYLIKADIKSYFASIDHDVLFAAIRRVISCPRTLALWRAIARGYGHADGLGLPVGALTSQLSANVLLDQLDHHMIDHCGVGRYVRYMDDTVIVLPTKQAAHATLVALEDEVTRLGLRLNPKTCILPAPCGVDFCGYRTWATHRLPRKRNIKRARKLLARTRVLYGAGVLDADRARARLMSYLAYAKHCNAHNTTAAILNEFALTRS
jgi:retron-type reverse transcriptase